jgi:hypothetical protein
MSLFDDLPDVESSPAPASTGVFDDLPSDLPTRNPNLTTFYYPNTPQATRAAGLSYSMEGGTQGGGKFSDVDLRDHTLEQYRAGKSPFVAVAMKGDPTGEMFQTNDPVTGAAVTGKWIDTGGGLKDGQMDFATSNPDLARGGVKRTTTPNLGIFGDLPDVGRSFGPQAGAGGIPDVAGAAPQPVPEPTPADLGPPMVGTQQPQSKSEILGKGIQEAAQEYAKSLGPLPQVHVNLPNTPQSQIPTAGAPMPTPIQVPPYAEGQQQKKQGNILQNATNAAYQTGSEFIPHSMGDVARMLTPLTPFASAPSNIAQGYDSVRSFIQGTPVNQIAQQVPGINLLKDADKTPPYSQERFAAGFQVLSQMGMLAAGAKAPDVVPQGISETAQPSLPMAMPSQASSREVPVPESFQPQATGGAAPEIVNRYEEPGVGRASVDKPHGIYTTPDQYESPHADLGGPKFQWKLNPNAKILDVTGMDAPPMRQMASGSSPGVAAAKHLLPPEIANSIRYGMGKSEAIEIASKRFPNVDWNRYYDAQEVIEGLGGMEAKKAGYDIIKGDDTQMPEFSERVLLTKNAGTPHEPPPNAAEPNRPSSSTKPSLNPVRDSGPFRRTYKIDKELGEKMDARGAAAEYGNIASEYAHRNTTHELSKAQEDLLGKLLLSERLKKTNPLHPQVLDPISESQIRRDPAITKAENVYRKDVESEIEDLHTRAGVDKKAIDNLRGSYFTLKPEVDANGNVPLLSDPGFVVRPGDMSKTTRFARAAEGQAAKYVTDIRDVLRSSYTEAAKQAALRDLYNSAKEKGVAEPSSRFVPDPEGGPNAGKWVKSMEARDLPQPMQQDLQLIANQESRITDPHPAQKALQSFQRGSTALELGLNPPVLLSHMRRILGIMASKPPLGYGALARVEAMLPYFGPRIGAMKRAMSDMSTPEMQGILKDITQQGGGSSRAFGQQYTTRGKFAGATGVTAAQEFSHNLLFSVPKGKGIMGFDLRMRAVLEKMRRDAEPALAADKQRMRENSNQLGQYGTMKSWPVQAMQHVAPFSATSMPMRWSELKTFIGNSGFKGDGKLSTSAMRTVETAMRGTGGTILMAALVNKALSGHWPWQNSEGNEFNIDTGVTDKSGNHIHVPMTFFSPEVGRVLNSISVPDILKERMAAKPDYVSAGLRGPTNTAASLVSSPASSIALAAGPQVAARFERQPGQHGFDIMKVGQPTRSDKAGGSPTSAVAYRRLEGVAKEVNPAIGAILGYMDEPIDGLRPFGMISTDRSGGAARGVPPRLLTRPVPMPAARPMARPMPRPRPR